MILAGIATDAANFMAFVDEYEERREPFQFNESQIWRQRIGYCVSLERKLSLA